MKKNRRLTRRNLLKNLSIAAGAAILPGGALAIPRFFSPANRRGEILLPGKTEAVPLKLQPFPMTRVRLRAGIFQNGMEINRTYLHSLPNDRLLHMFRVTAGIASSADPVGGWEEPKSELRGHFTGGHYLSACALNYSSSGDEELKSKANALVAELAKCQKATNADGYLGAYPTEFYDRLRDHKKVWAPFYTYHKIMVGHLDMYLHCGNEQALDTAENMAGWVGKYLKPIGDDQWSKMQMVEHGGMNEALFNLYAVTGKEQYLALARRFDHKRFFDPLAGHRDELKGLHTNTNIPKVIGAARGYELTGDQRYREIADYFWHEITSQRAYCTGGTSNDEGWRTEPGKLASELGPAAEECCCGYNMLKLTRHVFGWTGEPQAMDYYERTLFNSRLGTQDRDGMLMYYLPLQPGMWKTFGTPFDSFWCCTGTGVEEFAKSNDTIYFHDAQGIYVNLFIASEVNWPEKKIRLVQDTNFPEETGTTLTMKTKAPVQMPLHIRVPYWTGQGFAVSVNGEKQEVSATPSTYVTLDRQWKDGDKIEVSLPMKLHVAPIPDNASLQAMMYGPLVLAGRLGTADLSKDLIYGPSAPDEKKTIPVPEIAASGKDPTGWVEPAKDERLAFRTVGQSENFAMIPLYKLFNERYTVYWRVHGKTA
jgi:uncharacterized protein